MKQVAEVRKNVTQHWVGDGFPVRSLFSYHDPAEQFSPFLLLDYAGPYEFSPTEATRGVGEHPHRGFETVTIVYQGELEHRDSSGASGAIGPGDVQWMTAAAGVVHEEFHSKGFTKSGGLFEVIQLWVNLPAADKMSKPRYQEIRAVQIPKVALANEAGEARVIAGELLGVRGPAKTFTPVHLWDLKLSARKSVQLSVPEGYSAAAVVRRGALAATNQEVGAGDLIVFTRQGAGVELSAAEDAELLLLAGRPIDEPVVGHGPFVMNTVEQINQAVADYRAGRMGKLVSSE